MTTQLLTAAIATLLASGNALAVQDYIYADYKS